MTHWLHTYLPRLKAYFEVAWEGLITNKLRSLLSALGIIFGVAAVIAMLAIGAGAKQEILEQMEMVGVNNIHVKPVIPEREQDGDDDKQAQKKFTPGLTLKDARSIADHIPGIRSVSPEVVYRMYAVSSGKGLNLRLAGVTPAYFEINNLRLQDGKSFEQAHIEHGKPVCVIGSQVKARLFSNVNPIGKSMKCGDVWFRVIGVLESKRITDGAIEDLGIRDYNHDVFAPVQTVLLRVNDRSEVTRRDFSGGNDNNEEDEKDKKAVNYHQLDQIVVQVTEREQLEATAGVIKRMLLRRHNEVSDFELEVPQLLLQQEARTRNIFNIVLGAIAGISLLVGGIGIMNVMLASVMERIKEIGLRLSVGATQYDIMGQFLLESTLISFTGGLLGVLLGIVLAASIGAIAGIPTIVNFWAIFISFTVATGVGLIFGFMPARKAALLNPIDALRYE